MSTSTILLTNAVLCGILLALVLTNVVLLRRIRRALNDFAQQRDQLTAVAQELAFKVSSTRAEIIHLVGSPLNRPRIGALR